MEYRLVSHWHLAAPVDRVFVALHAADEWPAWWPFVKRVQELAPGDGDGVGALRRYTWSSRLPYDLSFNMRVTQVQRPFFMEGTAEGELTGTGRWFLSADGDTTRVRYEWTVVTTKAWMNLFAPVMAPVFRWNHNQVMEAGGRGLARHLGVSLLGFDPPDGVRERADP
jgi:hypothetical protein